MSGHSHYSTIKRKKEAQDAQRGRLFSKLSRAISVAVKTGGGPDPEKNSKLRMAIDQAKDANMPKDNIKRAIQQAETKAENLEEVIYEGFAPQGVGVIVEAATDNRNRTAQEMKGIFERGGGRLAGPGSVSYNFDQKGMIVIEKENDTESQMLKLIDLGVEDVQETEDYIEVYVESDKLISVKEDLEGKGYKVKKAEIVYRPKVNKVVSDEKSALKVLKLLEKVEDHDDTQKVFADVEIPEDVMEEIEFD
ncbi:MAG: YebC/PmpR family DNA-binding transcriptional regulator [Candidatus Woesebacteria bacterium]|jgi:YebC/PmpR family DNA-binding regulatory protein